MIVRRAADRFVTRTGWLTSWHCFSYQEHYDPANTHFGLLLACNEDTLAPGAGFERHEHREIEALTWVLSGALRHEDSAGNAAVLRPGAVQRMTAGRGVWHSERNASEHQPVHYVQMWLAPGAPGLEPSYQQADVAAALAAGTLVPVAAAPGAAPAAGTGAPAAAPVRLHQPAATLHAARLPPRTTVTLPAAPFVHAFVTAGSLTAADPALGAGDLRQGDSLRLRGPAPPLGAGPAGAELLVWAMHRDLY